MQYLSYLGYEATVSVFQEELQSMGKSAGSVALPRNDDQKSKVKVTKINIVCNKKCFFS